MEIIQKLAHRSNYGSNRTIQQIKYIVIHYTANDGDKAWNNANYFQNNPNLKASAHYFVDDNYVYQSVPDTYVAYAVGGAKYTDCSRTGGGELYGYCNNTNSISIELCDTNRNGEIYPTQATINRAVELTKELMKKYGVPSDRVIRHFDVNGKHCPSYWMDSIKWEREFHSKITTKSNTPRTELAQKFNKSLAGTYTVKTTWAYFRKGAGSKKKLIKKLKKGDKVTCHGYYSLDGKNRWLYCLFGTQIGFVWEKRLKK